MTRGALARFTRWLNLWLFGDEVQRGGTLRRAQPGSEGEKGIDGLPELTVSAKGYVAVIRAPPIASNRNRNHLNLTS